MKANILLCAAALIVPAHAASAQTVGANTAAFPGDLGQAYHGLPPSATSGPPWPSLPAVARGPSSALAMRMVQGAVAACKSHTISISIIDSAGLPKLYFVTDGAAGYNAYTGFRKAYTALTFKMPTSKVGELTKTDASVVAKLASDTSLMAFSGGLPIVVGGEVIGAIGVSGVHPVPGVKMNPGLEDQKCAQAGLDSVKGLLK